MYGMQEAERLLVTGSRVNELAVEMGSHTTQGQPRDNKMRRTLGWPWTYRAWLWTAQAATREK